MSNHSLEKAQRRGRTNSINPWRQVEFIALLTSTIDLHELEPGYSAARPFAFVLNANRWPNNEEERDRFRGCLSCSVVIVRSFGCERLRLEEGRIASDGSLLDTRKSEQKFWNSYVSYVPRMQSVVQLFCRARGHKLEISDVCQR